MLAPSRRIESQLIQSAALMALIGLIILSAPTTGVHAATSANLSVASSTNVLLASTNATLLLEITNVGSYLKELDIALTIPAPLVLFEDNHWIRSSFARGDTIRANVTVFAPSSAAGATVQGSVVAVYKAVGETTASTETHAISFLVRGWIDIKVYEVTVDPDPVLPGSEITISGNLLNRGVIPAMYANVTLASDRPFLDSVKPTYVGEVDPNAPAPFTVTAIVDSDATEGSHRASILVYYRDDLQLDHAITVPVSFTVVSELPNTETTRTGIIDQLLSNPAGLLSNPVVLLGLVAIILLLAIVAYVRRKKRMTVQE